ncbi:MAG: methyltransferase domain-containing protein [Sphingorhabdus sp.]
MAKPPSSPVLFDNQRRMALLDRASSRRAAKPFLWEYVAAELCESLKGISRPFERALIIGPLAILADRIFQNRIIDVTLAPTSHADAQALSVEVVSEDRLPFTPSDFDLIIAAGNLDSVNDLPGLLIQIRRLLVPDGLFLGSLFGAGSLAQLKSAMIMAEGDRASTHIHPQIELRTLADLLSRVGFALPVADRDIIDVRYSDWRQLVADLRDHGLGNALLGDRRYLGKKFLHQLDDAWLSLADIEQRVTEQYVLLNMSGWAPGPDQPKPARRGSATISLADILSSGQDADDMLG